jgi:hypothetical protein
MTVIAEAGRDVPMARLPMSEMAAQGGATPMAEATHAAAHATMRAAVHCPVMPIVVAVPVEMRVIFPVREAVSGEVAKKAAVAETAVTAAKAVRRRIDLGQGEAKDNGSHNGE